jgi:hypothetical protein
MAAAAGIGGFAGGRDMVKRATAQDGEFDNVMISPFPKKPSSE